MTANDLQQLHLASEGLAMLLHGQSCPVGYRCQASDCIECLQIYIDRGGETNGSK